MAAWLSREDEAFVRASCPGGVEAIDGGRELSQSCIARVRLAGGQVAFFKRSCVAALQAKSPRNPDAKWRVTQRSFANEHAFLRDGDLRTALVEKGMHIPRTLALGTDGPEDDFATSFRTLTEYLDLENEYIEKQTYDPDGETPRLFTWLAKFHAHFWGDANKQLRERFLESGGWWRKCLRPTVKWDQLAPSFAHTYKQFPVEFERFDFEQCMKDLAEMTRMAKQDCFLRALGDKTNTLVHGDVKTCNFFIKSDSLEVTAIDFQWVGSCVSGAADIVYFFYGGVTSFPESEETLEEFIQRMKRHEIELKQHYFAEFKKALTENNTAGASDLTEDEFHLHYELELLEYFTTAIPYLIPDLTPKLVKKNRRKYGYLTYEFDERMTSFFFQRAFEAYAFSKSLLLPLLRDD